MVNIISHEDEIKLRVDILFQEDEHMYFLQLNTYSSITYSPRDILFDWLQVFLVLVSVQI